MKKEKYIERVENMTNFILFEEHCGNIIPDDYDSCHTKFGQMKLDVTQNEVDYRIANDKFLK